MYSLKGIDLIELFSNTPAHRVMNIIDQIFLEEAMLGEEGQEHLHMARARLDNVYDKLADDNRQEDTQQPKLDEEIIYDLDSMDPEYVKKAQQTKGNQRSTLKYVQPTDSGFPGLGQPMS